jgi:hypothetical protein
MVMLLFFHGWYIHNSVADRYIYVNYNGASEPRWGNKNVKMKLDNSLSNVLKLDLERERKRKSNITQ